MPKRVTTFCVRFIPDKILKLQGNVLFFIVMTTWQHCMNFRLTTFTPICVNNIQIFGFSIFMAILEYYGKTREVKWYDTDICCSQHKKSQLVKSREFSLLFDSRTTLVVHLYGLVVIFSWNHNIDFCCFSFLGKENWLYSWQS